MPYEGQRSSFKPIQRISNNKRIQESLAEFEGTPLMDLSKGVENLLVDNGGHIFKCDGSKAKEIKKVFSIDGSFQIADWSSTTSRTVSYITHAAILTDMEKYREVTSERIIDPVEFRKIEVKTSRESVLPGENTIMRGVDTPRDSFRKKLYGIFCEPEFSQMEIPLLETLDILINHTEEGKSNIRCPYNDSGCDGRYQYSKDISQCQYCGGTTYPTDWLRIHENLSEQSVGLALAISELGQVVEAITVVEFLRWIETEGLLGEAWKWAILIDGPLAVFGHPAELHRGIIAELKRINTICKAESGEDLAIAGIEKSGNFVEHFEKIDGVSTANGGSGGNGRLSPKNPTTRRLETNHGRVAGGTALILSSDYIKSWVIPNKNKEKDYGDGTYYGDKILYKSFGGSQIVLTLPKLYTSGRTKGKAPQIEIIPRLHEILRLIEETACKQYPNAVSPIISAHNEASIPLSLGKKILTNISGRLIKKNEEESKTTPERSHS